MIGADFVMVRGTLTRLLTLAMDTGTNAEGLKIWAVKFKGFLGKIVKKKINLFSLGVIFFFEKNTDAKNERISAKTMQGKMNDFTGLAFESLATGRNINASKFFAMMKSKFY